jgi:Leucine-rich repeat (LRR) protein
LDVAGTNVTSKGLAGLETCSKLEVISLRTTQLDHETEVKLQERHPGLFFEKFTTSATTTNTEYKLLDRLRDLGAVAFDGECKSTVTLEDQDGTVLDQFIVATERSADRVGFTVFLDGCAKVDEALDYIVALRTVEQLSLTGSRLCDGHMDSVGQLRSLRLLYAGDTQIGDAGVAHLANHENLEMLSLGNTRVTDEGLTHLRNIRSLKGLSLTNLAISDAGVSCLSDLPNLRGLGLAGTQITDCAIDHLSRMTNLRAVDLHGTEVTPAGIDRLKSALPKCRIGR